MDTSSQRVAAALSRGCRENPAAASLVPVMVGDGERGARRRGRAPQAGAAARRWLWSFRRLCVAAMSRHSLLHAALPRRWERLIWRVELILAHTGAGVVVGRGLRGRPRGG